MLTIYKYPLQVTDHQTVSLPKGAALLSVQFQGDQLCLWALVDPLAPRRTQVFWIVGTGHPMPPQFLEHVATVQHADGALVWHVFRESDGESAAVAA